LIRVHSVRDDDDSPRIKACASKVTQDSIRWDDDQIGGGHLHCASSDDGQWDDLGMVLFQSSELAQPVVVDLREAIHMI
jgi:hypothetical protein